MVRLNPDNTTFHQCVEHKMEELPMKGLGHDLSSVNLYEPIIIKTISMIEGVIWGYTEAEIERRAYELNADIKWMQLPSTNLCDSDTYQVWFYPISTNKQNSLGRV